MKKLVIFCISLVIISLCSITNVKAYSTNDGLLIAANQYETEYRDEDDDFSNTCASFSRGIRIVGIVLLFIKIFLPIVIIVNASFSLASVVIKGVPEQLKQESTNFIRSLVAAIIVFTVPIFINAMFGLLGKGTNPDAEICRSCIFEPFSKECTNYISDYDEGADK